MTKPDEKPKEEAPETPPAETPEEDPAVKALRILESMQSDSQKKPDQTKPQPTYSDVREKIKEDTGWTDAQVDFHMKSLGEAVGPVHGKLVMMEMKDKHTDFDQKAVEKELTEKGYPKANWADPVLLESIHYMLKGKKMSETPTPPAPTPSPKTPAPETKRIAPSYPGFESGVDSSRSPAASEPLVGEEKELARRMGISEEKWNKAKTTKVIKELV